MTAIVGPFQWQDLVKTIVKTSGLHVTACPELILGENLSAEGYVTKLH